MLLDFPFPLNFITQEINQSFVSFARHTHSRRCRAREAAGGPAAEPARKLSSLKGRAHSRGAGCRSCRKGGAGPGGVEAGDAEAQHMGHSAQEWQHGGEDCEHVRMQRTTQA